MLHSCIPPLSVLLLLHILHLYMLQTQQYTIIIVRIITLYYVNESSEERRASIYL